MSSAQSPVLLMQLCLTTLLRSEDVTFRLHRTVRTAVIDYQHFDGNRINNIMGGNGQYVSHVVTGKSGCTSKVRTLTDEEMRPGSYQLEWDTKGGRDSTASSGFYFCRLKTAQPMKSVKMLVLK